MATRSSKGAKDAQTIAKLIEDIDITMFTTVGPGGYLVSRPLSTQKAQFDGERVYLIPEVGAAYSAFAEAGWQVLKQAAFTGGIKNDTWYNVMLSVNGLTATLIVNNKNVFTHTFQATIVDGWAYGLNWGLVGFGSNKSRGAMDNISVQVVPPAATVTSRRARACCRAARVSCTPVVR